MASGLAGKERRRKAAPVPLDPVAHRQAEATGTKNHPLQGQSTGTTTEPFDGGAFTIEVLAHAGKGDREGSAVLPVSCRREGEQTAALPVFLSLSLSLSPSLSLSLSHTTRWWMGA